VNDVTLSAGVGLGGRVGGGPGSTGPGSGGIGGDVLVATDLDGTVMFSERAAAASGIDLTDATDLDLVGVDVHKGAVYAYMTTASHQRWANLAGLGVLVPVTTRSAEQYGRLRLPGRRPRLAVVANGAQLLVDDAPDPAWEPAMRARIAASGVASFDTVWSVVSAWAAHEAVHDARAVSDFFAYLRVHRGHPSFEEFLATVRGAAERWGWKVTLQGRKLYVVPAALCKSVAVAEVAERVSAGRVVAGGDSLLDAEMLAAADAAIRPAHGELHAVGWSADNCVTTTQAGPLAGDEILDWYAAQAA